MPWWEIFGWAGSVLVVLSLMVPSVRRFRILNLIGSGIATIYNAYFGIWPYAAMNGAIVLINIYWLRRLHQEGSTQERGYSVVEASGSDAIIARFLSRHEAAISESFPQFTKTDLDSSAVFLVMHEEEVIGLFAVRSGSAGVGEIVIDFVTERFRDLTPGHFVYANRALFSALDVERLSLRPGMTTDVTYFRKQGFSESGDVLVKELT